MDGPNVLELTNDVRILPALLIASVMAYGLTVLVMKRSILTAKLARRGYHISREYTTDPLERIQVGEVMTTDVVTDPASLPLRDLVRDYFFGPGPLKHAAYPVLGKNGQFLGIVTQSNLLEHWLVIPAGGVGGPDPLGASPIIAYDLIELSLTPAYPDESCRGTAERLAGSGARRLPVVSPQDPTRLLGIVAIVDLLKARQRVLAEEDKRERFFGRRELTGRVQTP